MLAPIRGRRTMAMSLITILLAITALVMVSIQTADDAPEEVRMDLDKFLQSEVQKMSKMDVVNAHKAMSKAMKETVKGTAKKPRPKTAVKEEMIQQIQDDKPAKKAGPSLMTVASSEYLRHKKSKESDEWMDADEDDDKELAMPSVTKEGDVAMFQEHTSRRSRSLDRLLNGNKRKLSEKKMDSFSASLLGDVAPPTPKHHKPHVHLSRLLEPRSTRMHVEHKHSEHHKKLAEVKKEKKQAQHKKKELKKMNQFREHMKSFWAQAHANDPKKKKIVPKPVAKPKRHVICKPPTCLPRGHHYEHPHVAAAKTLKDEDPLSVLEQAYPNKKIKKVKKVSIWDKADPLRVADPLSKDLESSGAAIAIGATVARAHRRKAPRTLEDIIDQAPQDAFVQPIVEKKVVKVIKKVPKAPTKKPRAALDLDQENPWETDHFAMKMSNTWHTRNAMANMQMALTNAEHSNAIDVASKMAPKLSRKERIAQKTRMLKRKLRVSLKQVKKKFNHAFVRRQERKKAAAKAKKAKKKLKKQKQLKKKQAKEAVVTHTATSAVETAFANVFDSAWRKQAPKMGQNLPHGPGA